MQCADIAQLVEHILGKDEVTGSNPVISSIFMPLFAVFPQMRAFVFRYRAELYSL